MPLTVFYSVDPGLLDMKIEVFSNKYPDAQRLHNASLEDLSLFLMQQTIFDQSSNYVIQEFSGDTSLLFDFLKTLDRQNKNILVTITTKESFVIPDDLLDNKIPKISALNKATKINYLDRLLKYKNINIGADEMRKISLNIDTSAVSINSFVGGLEIYKEVDSQVIDYLLSIHGTDVSIFSFFFDYFSDNHSSWMSILRQKTSNSADLASFLKMFSYKICEFNFFLRDKEFKKTNSKAYFIFMEYEKIYQKYEDNIKKYIKQLIFKFLVFVEYKILNLNNASYDVQYFFLINHINKFNISQSW